MSEDGEEALKGLVRPFKTWSCLQSLPVL